MTGSILAAVMYGVFVLGFVGLAAVFIIDGLGLPVKSPRGPMRRTRQAGQSRS
jgi:hypothetical protein